MKNQDKELKQISNLKIEREEIVYDKKDTNTILEESSKLDLDKISKEILIWLIKNVEQYICNTTTVFKLDLVLDNDSKTVEDMNEIKKLQDLYRAIPEDDVNNEELLNEIIKVRKKLDKITEKVMKKISSDKVLLEDLFKRMSFYYELKGFNKGKALLQTLEGEVCITKFEYEAFSVGVRIRKPVKKENSAEIDGYDAIKEYVIPEGFTVWMEIAFNPVSTPTSMF